MTESQIKEYLNSGGVLFTIKSIDTIRDGGTIAIETSNRNFYIHKDTKKFHTSYYPTDVNRITDPLLIEYLIERIDTYIKRSEDDIKRNKELLKEIQNNK